MARPAGRLIQDHRQGSLALLEEPAATAAAPSLRPLLKWTGGKADELPLLLPRLPTFTGRYFEPFVGGGAMFFAQHPDRPAVVNDLSRELIGFYRLIKFGSPALFACLDAFERLWRRIDLRLGQTADALARWHRGGEMPAVVTELAVTAATELGFWLGADCQTIATEVAKRCRDKSRRIARIEARRDRQLAPAAIADNLAGALKGALYYLVRDHYNRSPGGPDDAGRIAAYFLLKELAYAAMWRVNGAGGMNVPFGGITYSRKNLRAKIDALRAPALHRRFASTILDSDDFAEHLERHRPGPDDFVFLDPPYDTTFSGYDGSPFAAADQARLAALLRGLPARWLLVIKDTPLVRQLYGDGELQILAFDKAYSVEYMGRNAAARRVTHLLIANYPLGTAISAPS